MSTLHKAVRLAMIGIAIVLWLPSFADANSSIVQGAHPGIVFPIHSDKIKLVRERVDLSIEWVQDRMHVVSVMELQNLGPADTVLFGYPEDYQEWLYENPVLFHSPDTGGFRLHNFQASIDGQTRPHTRQSGQDAPGLFNARSWLVWSVPFEANQSRTLVVEYNAWGFGDAAGNDVQRYEYVIGTANSYCDTPERIEVSFHARLLPPERCTVVPGNSALSYTPDDYYQVNWTWKFDDYRPGVDEVIVLGLGMVMQFKLLEEGPWRRYYECYGERGYYYPERLSSLAGAMNEQNLLPEYRMCCILAGDAGSEFAAIRERVGEGLLANGLKTSSEIAANQTGRLASGIDVYIPEELALYRNLIYARRGYPFQDQWWREFFAKTDWYRALTPEEWAANPNPFSPEEQVLIDAIRTRERQLAPAAGE